MTCLKGGTRMDEADLLATFHAEKKLLHEKAAS